MGYFAAIIIQTSDVVIDLMGHEIKQSLSFYFRQRFYSHIELGSAPFVPRFGPHDFSSKFKRASRVTIKNGTLGLSSHHGIHGNECSHIRIENLRIRDFEVGGININEGRNITVENVEVGPSSDKVAI